MKNGKEAVLKEFRQIPGVGAAIAEDFWNIGLRSLENLKNANGESLYRQLREYDL